MTSTEKPTDEVEIDTTDDSDAVEETAATDEVVADAEAEAAPAIESDDDAAPEVFEKSAPSDRVENGPNDVSEVTAVRPYVDLGGIKIVPRENLHLRLEVDEKTKRVVALGVEYQGSLLQVQAFSAPRSSGVWHEIRAQVLAQLAKQGARAEEVDGPFGPEVRAIVPAATADGQQGVRPMRIIGVDGPRWFLRGTIAGNAITDKDAAAAIEGIFRSIVVVRGTNPMPPKDLLPLSMPTSANTALKAGA